MKKLLGVILALLILGLSLPVFMVQADTEKTQWFDSVRELEKWVENNKLPLRLIADGSGKISLKDYLSNPIYDCDDYAEDLVDKAESQGYRIMECPVQNGRVFSVKVINIAGSHVGCWTKVNNVYYYIEPFPRMSRVVKICDAD